MLFVSLREGDYLMIGDDVRINYDRMDGKDYLVLGIEAPKDVPVLRGKVYEANLAKMAAEGNEEAREHAEKLAKAYETRQRRYNARRARRQRQEQRLASKTV